MVTPRVALAVVGMLAVVVAAACLTLVPAPASETAGADGDGLTGDGAVLSDEPGGVQLDGLPADPSGGAPDESGDPAGLEASPAASPAAIVVHVAGAVVAGGVVELPAGARVHEAVSAVGGARSDADLAAVNLARVLVDGERVYIPVPGETPPAVDEGPAGSVGMPGAGGLPPASGSGGGVNAELIDINTADAAALMELPGIGPVLADRIVAHRTANGPFPDVESLADVSGIGPAILDSVRDLVAVE
jgi:competence protein ComEA